MPHRGATGSGAFGILNVREPQSGTSDIKRSRGRPPAQDEAARRAQIVETAHETFAQLGYASTTTDIVASRCQISKQTLYRLFPSKEELFIAATMTPAQTLLDLPRPTHEDVAIEEVIARIFRIDSSTAIKAGHAALIVAVVNEMPEVPEMVRKLALRESRHARNCLADWLRGEMAKGTLRIDSPESGARLLMDMIFAGAYPRDGWADEAARREHLGNCIRFFLRGASAS